MPGQDSFLDIVANIVGILIILVRSSVSEPRTLRHWRLVVQMSGEWPLPEGGEVEECG